MARDFAEVARFRGDDKAYSEGWDRVFGNKNKKLNEEDSNDKERDDIACDVEGKHSRHAGKDDDSPCADNA